MSLDLVKVDGRLAFGKSCREQLHRADQFRWERKNGIDPVAFLAGAVKDRVPSLLPVKWARMAVSPFGFFRGAVPLMAADLAASPHTGIMTQICGDAHVRNLGAYAAPDGRLIFDINDFDETIRGPWEWDIKRLATSLVLAGRDSGDSEKCCEDAVLQFVAAYRNGAAECCNLTVLELAHYQVRRQRDCAPVASLLLKAEKATPKDNLQKLTEIVQGKLRFREEKPLLTRVDSTLARSVVNSLEAYRTTLSSEHRHFVEFYRPVDVAFKVVGTGSVGVRDYVVLCLGSGPEDPLFLQVKQELPSAYAAYLDPKASRGNEGQRVVEGQRLMQAQSDIFLGWTSIDGRDYLVRQLSDHKASIDAADLKGHTLIEYAGICGQIFAKGHARSGDACAIAGYCGDADKLDKAIAQFAVSYADQTEKDHQQLLAAIKSGKLDAAAEA